jgi:hypothetical protein
MNLNRILVVCGIHTFHTDGKIGIPISPRVSVSMRVSWDSSTVPGYTVLSGNTTTAVYYYCY